jgi:uncharacterized protein
MEHRNYKCPKCNNRQYETDVMSTTGGGLSRIFDIQSRRYTTVSCTQCGYTDIFKKQKGSTLENIFDLFTT